MGKLIKINMYVEKNKYKNNPMNINILEKNFATYEKWLEKTNKQDGIENYKKFLIMAQFKAKVEIYSLALFVMR